MCRFDRGQIGQLVLATQRDRGCGFADHHANIGVIANADNGFHRILMFQGHVFFEGFRQLGEDIGLRTVDMLGSGNEQSIPQRVNQPRTQKFQTPLTSLIGVPFLNVLGQHFAYMGSGMSRKGRFLKISNRTGISDLHYF